MATEESNDIGTPCKSVVPQDETQNRPLLPDWTRMQAYYNPGSTQIPLLNPHATGSYLYHHMTPNQDAALVFSQKVHQNFGKRNLDSKNNCAGNRDGMSMKDFSSTMNQQFNMVLGNENSTVFNHNLGTGLNASSISAQLTKLEADQIRKERKRQSNRESAKRSRLRKQQECDELYQNIDTLKGKNKSLTEQLRSLSEECEALINENDSIEEELVKTYGPESIADLLPMKPAGGCTNKS
ncbi:G-box-binding factor 1-like [Lotus japonicus]|uniref:G-box-binding factor 1-like n=1 Tax=Lotus japonicus TaxID=34305 RepID=UPI00258CCEDF|nr:G-box-binding factor 1-like [Lotus japonicus]